MGLARSVDGSGYMIVIVIENRRDGVGSSELLYYSLVFVCWSRLFCRLFRRRIALSRFVLVSFGVAELRKVDAGVLPRRWLRKLVRYRCVGHCTLFCRLGGGRRREEGKHSPQRFPKRDVRHAVVSCIFLLSCVGRKRRQQT